MESPYKTDDKFRMLRNAINMGNSFTKWKLNSQTYHPVTNKMKNVEMLLQ
jgi:hypothetical protein